MSVALIAPFLFALLFGAWTGWTRGGVSTRRRKVGEIVTFLVFMAAWWVWMEGRSYGPEIRLETWLALAALPLLSQLSESGSRRVRHRRDRVWCRKVAGALALDAPEGEGDRPPGGKIDGISVSLEGTPGKTLLTLHELYAPVVLTLNQHAPERILSEAATFESLYQVGGTELERLVVFDAAARRALVTLAGDLRVRGLTVREGALQVELGGEDPEEIAALTREVVQALGFLFRPVDEVARLLQILEEETSTSARILALRQIVERGAPRKTIQRAFRVAGASKDPALRALAAFWHLDAAALEAADRDGGLESPETLDLMSRLNFTESDRAQRRAIGLLLVRSRGEATWAFGAEILQNVSVKVDEEVERALLPHATATSRRLQRAVAEALGVVGSAAAVPALSQLAETGSSDVREAAVRSLRAVRARLTGVEAGAIRLAQESPEQGAIRVAEEQEGAIRVAAEAQRRPAPQALKG